MSSTVPLSLVPGPPPPGATLRRRTRCCPTRRGGASSTRQTSLTTPCPLAATLQIFSRQAIGQGACLPTDRMVVLGGVLLLGSNSRCSWARGGRRKGRGRGQWANHQTRCTRAACAHLAPQVFGPAFRRNARWSVDPKVPDMGGPDEPWSKVSAFYDFWFGFRSWREFPHPDEEDIECAESREHRRWIDRWGQEPGSRACRSLNATPRKPMGGAGAAGNTTTRAAGLPGPKHTHAHVYLAVFCIALAWPTPLSLPAAPSTKAQLQAARERQEGGGQAAEGVCGRRVPHRPTGGRAQGGGAPGAVRSRVSWPWAGGLCISAASTPSQRACSASCCRQSL